ncbi:uncharacterized protein LOC108917121 [Anoplophora glabripennis]|uniref:uncharacterized protein LOC108917121 n=1 Tax=Anoplophora glabripennis TaxID=217634 RepID=UPI000875628A|nr:uncharacterized protein LOC108917121 [Anoplophora glabripennis]
MFRVILSTLCLTFGVFVSVKAEKSCDSLGTLIYEDMACRPVKKDGRGCAIQYECDDVSQKIDSCFFRGKSYPLYGQLRNELTNEDCGAECTCHNYFGTPSFVCLLIYCVNGQSFDLKPGCYDKYELDKCCPVGMTCPSEDNPLAECHVDGKVYKEGEKFYPKDTCLKCVCGKGWNGRFEHPFCKRSLCSIQFDGIGQVHSNCAPLYLNKEVLCCPITWVCPTYKSDHITKINNNVDSNSDLFCVFGSKTLKLGEGFQRKVSYFLPPRDVQCECIVPPLLTCKVM